MEITLHTKLQIQISKNQYKFKFAFTTKLSLYFMEKQSTHKPKNQHKPIAAAHSKNEHTHTKGFSLEDNRTAPAIQTRKNKTGLPNNLKSGIENISGHSLDDVKVHYNSSKPAQLNAHAYAQGKHIHVAPGQEKHLPHEAWHVVQQKQGRVRPTKTVSGASINDDVSLEKEADVMGKKAVQLKQKTTLPLKNHSKESSIVQRAKYIGNYFAKNDGNVRNDKHQKIGNYKKDDVISVNSSKMKGFTTGLLFGSKNHVYGTVNDVSGWIVEDNIGGWKEHLPPLKNRKVQKKKLWNNVPSKFTSKNTVNSKGNSMYTVTSHDLYRYAPVNKDPKRNALDQVYHDSICRHVAFTSDNNALEKLHNPAFKTGEVSYENGKLMAKDEEGKILVEIPIQLAPKVGLTVLDFDYVGGRLSGRHVGHEIVSVD